jgi:transcriptional regulator with XRE-family HTH domain
MARLPRPVDPDEGPLQAFAYDLRKLREKAGTPTYRTLARKAGYSPATLSEAARGQRRPSLDVTMAYVGACGGDPDEWRVRWHDLAATKTETSTKTAADAGTEPADPVKAAAPGEPAPQPSHTRWRRWMRPPVLAVALVLVAAVTGAVVLAQPWASDEPPPDGCPRANAAGRIFTGRTYTFTRVRDAATLSAPVTRTMPAGCTVVFSGYCLGDTVTDETSQTPDIRWFILAGGGLMSSGVVHGNPPPRLGPTSCPGDISPPGTIRLNVSRIEDELRLQATGEGVKIVGFTSLDTGETGSPRWHQLSSLTPSPTSMFEIRWQPRRGTDPPSPSQHIIVAAVACLGGDGPTTVIDAQEIHPGDRLRTTPTSLSGTELDAATHSACQYPNPADLPGHS